MYENKIIEKKINSCYSKKRNNHFMKINEINENGEKNNENINS